MTWPGNWSISYRGRQAMYNQTHHQFYLIERVKATGLDSIKGNDPLYIMIWNMLYKDASDIEIMWVVMTMQWENLIAVTGVDLA